MTEKRRAGTNARCPSYRGVCLIEVSIKRELTHSVYSPGWDACPLQVTPSIFARLPAIGRYPFAPGWIGGIVRVEGVANGLSKITGLAKFSSNFTGLAVSFFEWFCMSRSLNFLQSRFKVSIRSRNLKSQKVLVSQRKTLVSLSHKVSNLPFATPSFSVLIAQEHSTVTPARARTQPTH